MSSMKAELLSTNMKVNHGELTFTTYDNKVLVVFNGEVIASINISTMADSYNNPTKNFWCEFKPKSCQTYPSAADVFVK